MPRANLPKQNLEIPLDEQIPEPEDLPPMPEHRIPYSMNMVTQMPNHEHLKDESQARKYLEQKITHALAHFEDFIRHVEVRFVVQEHFHREKAPAHKKVVRAKAPKGLEEVEAFEDLTYELGGPRMPAPYQLKVVVSLKNNKQVVHSNPEKHAQASLQECTDLAVEGLGHLLREEKDKIIKKNRKAKGEEVFDPYISLEAQDLEEAELQAQAAQRALDMQDAVMESFYEAVEAGSEDKVEPTERPAARAAAAAPAAAAVSPKAKPRAAAPAEAKREQQQKPDKGDGNNPLGGVLDLLLR